MGGVLGILLGAVLGWLSGHVAVLVPSGRSVSRFWRLSPLQDWMRIEHLLGALLGAAALGLNYRLNASVADFVVTSIFALLLIAILLIDLRHHLVYPLMPLTGVLLGVVLNPIGGDIGATSSLLATLLATLAFLGLFLLGKFLFGVEALGSGDVFLAAMIGAMVGTEFVWAALFLGSIFGAVASLVLLVARSHGRRDYIPFGTGMCLAAILVLAVR